MIEIGTAPLGDRFIDAVRAALRDPDLALWSFSRADDGYVDAQGRPQVLPPRNDPREATALIRDGVLVGAVVYDPAVADQPRLLAAVRAATTLALDNQRLQGELRGAVRRFDKVAQRAVDAGFRTPPLPELEEMADGRNAATLDPQYTLVGAP